MVTVRWEEKNRRSPWGSWHSFEWISQHAGQQNGRRGGRESPTRHSRREYRGQRYYGAAGSAHLGLARFRGTSTALRILDALLLAQKGDPSAPHIPLPRRRISGRLGRSKVQSSARFVSAWGGGSPPNLHTLAGTCKYSRSSRCY